jgi:hypothetical protein
MNRASPPIKKGPSAVGTNRRPGFENKSNGGKVNDAAAGVNSDPRQFTFYHLRPQHGGKDVVSLLSFLYGRGWVRASQIKTVMGWKPRKSRLIANESDGQIISGEKGYKLTSEATLEEIVHAARRLRSQAKEMLRRSIAIERVRHGSQNK